MTARPVPETFAVAFTFAGEERELVEEIVSILEERLGRGTVFYDKWFEHYLAGEGADKKLQDIYKTKSKLVVLGVSAAYGKKKWTLTEYEAVRARQMESRESDRKSDKDRILPLRVGDGDVEGIQITAIVPDIRNRPASETSDLIIDRLQLVESNLDLRDPVPKSPPMRWNRLVVLLGIMLAIAVGVWVAIWSSMDSVTINAKNLQSVVNELSAGLAIAHPARASDKDSVPLERTTSEIIGQIYERWDLRVEKTHMWNESLPDHPPYLSGIISGTTRDFSGNERTFQFEVQAVAKVGGQDVTQLAGSDISIRGKVHSINVDHNPNLIILVDCEFTRR